MNAEARIALGLLAAGFLVLAGTREPRSQPLPPPRPSGLVTTDPRAVRVVDGDTIVVAGMHYRLLGFDTPEIHGRTCPAELALGLRAAARTRQLIDGGRFALTTQGRLEKYGRTLGSVTIGGEDLGKILVAEGLAVVYSGRGQRSRWGCPQEK